VAVGACSKGQPETFQARRPRPLPCRLGHHADLLDAAFWQARKARILAGHVHDVFPYDPARRFVA